MPLAHALEDEAQVPIALRFGEEYNPEIKQ